MSAYERLDAWVEANFEAEVEFLRALVRVSTATPPGDNAPNAALAAELLEGFGLAVERHEVSGDEVRRQGMESITNLIVRRRYAVGPIVALNAHGDAVPAGEGWTHDPYGAEIVDDRLYGRGAAVNKSDFATFTFALRALESLGATLHGGIDLLLTYDEEFGGELGPEWLLARGLTRPDLLIAAGMSHQVVTAHNGCLQLEVSVIGRQAHAAIPDTGVDALRGANAILTALYQRNDEYQKITSKVVGIHHPYINIGRIDGGVNTNVVPGRVVLKLDRRMIPEEDPTAVEVEMRKLIEDAAHSVPGVAVALRRLLLDQQWRPTAANGALVALLQRHGEVVLGEPIPALGTPLYTDVRLFAARGIPAAIYGAGPRGVADSNAKRGDEHLVLSDLKAATRVVARTLYDLLGPDARPEVRASGR